MLDGRVAQMLAGELTFCECGRGQRAKSFYEGLAAGTVNTLTQELRKEKRNAYLKTVDGLKPEERTITFDRVILGAHNRAAYDAIRTAVARRNGLVTLHGKFGVGKSFMLMAAVNESRAAGLSAVYVAMADLLDWLRASFKPDKAKRTEEDGPDLSYERRWQLLVTCKVLVIDEIDEMNPTPWALERLCRLFDERWRDMEKLLTICALNANVETLPGKVASRLRDGRAQVLEINGADMRPYQVRK